MAAAMGCWTDINTAGGTVELKRILHHPSSKLSSHIIL